MFIERNFTLKKDSDLLTKRGIKPAQGKDFKPMAVNIYFDRIKDKG
jgi:hypothetical protein